MNNDLRIPDWLLRKEDITPTEKLVYAIYYSYTFFGKYGCCRLVNEDIIDRLKISKRSLYYAKSRLKEKKYIETDGGIMVKALVNE